MLAANDQYHHYQYIMILVMLNIVLNNLLNFVDLFNFCNSMYIKINNTFNNFGG
jgi:hypothetical protein